MKKNAIIYRLTVVDIQTVSNQEIGRDLSTTEIESVIGEIADKIPWYDAIADSISEKVGSLSNS